MLATRDDMGVKVSLAVSAETIGMAGAGMGAGSAGRPPFVENPRRFYQARSCKISVLKALDF